MSNNEALGHIIPKVPDHNKMQHWFSIYAITSRCRYLFGSEACFIVAIYYKDYDPSYLTIGLNIDRLIYFIRSVRFLPTRRLYLIKVFKGRV